MKNATLKQKIAVYTYRFCWIMLIISLLMNITVSIIDKSKKESFYENKENKKALANYKLKIDLINESFDKNEKRIYDLMGNFDKMGKEIPDHLFDKLEQLEKKRQGFLERNRKKYQNDLYYNPVLTMLSNIAILGIMMFFALSFITGIIRFYVY